MAGKALSREERMKWWHRARFGMFIHWGLYSLLERGEWVMRNERILPEEYAQLARRFRGARFDADAWAGLAREAGMKYMVLTTRHHDGFCLYDSKVSDYTAPKTAAGRDFVAEYVQACRKAGLKVGFYYSLLDWRFPGYFEPRRYRKSAAQLVAQAHSQVRELMTMYGKIDILWYDGGWLLGSPTPTTKRAMTAFWRAKRLNAMVRDLQPHIIINNRSGPDEDLDTPEQHVTASAAGKGWESCMTMGDSCGWGYIRNNPNMKTVPQLLQNLVIAAAGGGNYLLNIGPKADGTVRREEVVRLRAMGDWLKINGEAIYGSERCGLSGGMVGTWTAKGLNGYLHLFRWPGETAVVPRVKSRAKSATLLATGKGVRVRQEYNGRLVLSGLPRQAPHAAVSVVKVRFDGVPAPTADIPSARWLRGKE